MSDRASFDAFFRRYVEAVKKGDQAFLRGTLPPGIPDDHFEFLLQANQGMFGQIEAEKLRPDVKERDGCIELSYTMKGEDGEETLTRPFWWHQGTWVSYDPANPNG